MATRMQQRRGTMAEWTAANPVLLDGEIGFETDTHFIRVGDGVTAFLDLPRYAGNVTPVLPAPQVHRVRPGQLVFRVFRVLQETLALKVQQDHKVFKAQPVQPALQELVLQITGMCLDCPSVSRQAPAIRGATACTAVRPLPVRLSVHRAVHSRRTRSRQVRQ